MRALHQRSIPIGGAIGKPRPRGRSPLVVWTGARRPENLDPVALLRSYGVAVDVPDLCATSREPVEAQLERLREADVIWIGNCGSHAALISPEMERQGVRSIAIAGSHPILRGGTWALEWRMIEALKQLPAGHVRLVQGGSLRDSFWWCHYAPLVPCYHGTELRYHQAPARLPAFVTTRDLLKHLPGAVFRPRCVSTDIMRAIPRVRKVQQEYKRRRGVDLIVGHFPSNRSVKGSDVADRAVQLLRARGRRVEYWTLYPSTLASTRIPIALMPHVLNMCDYVLDQFDPKIQAFGALAVEAALCGAVPIANCLPGHHDDPDLADFILYARTAEEISSLLLRGARPTDRREDLAEYYSPATAAKVVLHWLRKWEMIP